MLTTNQFKKKYPRQFKYLINLYGGPSNIFDVSAAIYLYLNNIPPPVCEICNKPLSITKKFKLPVSTFRCNKHINTNVIVSKQEILSACTDRYVIKLIPDKFLTKTDQIEITCVNHGTYKVNIGNFLKGMSCQKCYHENRKGKLSTPRSDTFKKNMSEIRSKNPVKLSNESKYSKQQKQKIQWQLRKNDQTNYKKYLDKLSIRRKNYLKLNGYYFPNKEKTGLEIKFEQFLIKHNIKFESQYLLEGKKFDFFLPELMLLVEVDGEYWHRKESSKKNDIEKHKICIANNIQLVRISSDNFCPEIIFNTVEQQNKHTTNILEKRGIHGF